MRLLFFTALEGLEPPKCRNQNPVPYQLGDSPISTEIVDKKKMVSHPRLERGTP